MVSKGARTTNNETTTINGVDNKELETNTHNPAVHSDACKFCGELNAALRSKFYVRPKFIVGAGYGNRSVLEIALRNFRYKWKGSKSLSA